MTLATTLLSAPPAGYQTPLLVLAVPEGDFPPSLEALDRQMDHALRRIYSARDFKGGKDETALLYPSGPAARVLLVGMGQPPADPRGAVRCAAAVAGKEAQRIGAGAMAFHVVPELTGGDPAGMAQAATEGILAGAWRFLAMKRPLDPPKPELERVELLMAGGGQAAETGRARGSAIGAGHILAREVQMLPGNVCTPTYLATAAQDLARRHGFGVTVLDKAALESEGMRALLAVGEGSALEPRFIALEYKGGPGPPVVLIGKGVTFDSGGISIKPAERMEDMKYDMSGAAAVLGTFEMLGRLKPKVHVVGLIPSAENMPSGTAFRPGDVVKAHSGRTIEVVNTDAEGRLLLADALSYAKRYGPACVVDAATLTGAVIIGLGHCASAVLGTDDALIGELRRAGERAGERVWELPLWDDYRELIKSDIADMKNSGGRPAGTISAAWFLKEHIGEYPWAHLDIAGTAYAASDTAAMAKGPTGVGVRLFSEFLLGRS